MRRAPGRPAAVPWALRELLRDGPCPLDAQPPPAAAEELVIVLPAGAGAPSEVGVPSELVRALERDRDPVRIVAEAEVAEVAGADVVLAAGWAAAPAVLRMPGLRARAVLASPDPPPLAHLGWTAGVHVLGPPWLGGTLPPAADRAYAPMPVQRREDLVLVYGDDVLPLLAAVELLERRPGLSVAVAGAAVDLELPFPSIAIGSRPKELAHAFASATVAFAPPVRGWRPAAVAMLACGQAVVTSADNRVESVLGGAIACADSPNAAADAADRIMGDLELRGERVRAGLALVEGGWDRVADELLAQLRGLA